MLLQTFSPVRKNKYTATADILERKSTLKPGRKMLPERRSDTKSIVVPVKAKIILSVLRLDALRFFFYGIARCCLKSFPFQLIFPTRFFYNCCGRLHPLWKSRESGCRQSDQAAASEKQALKNSEPQRQAPNQQHRFHRR